MDAKLRVQLSAARERASSQFRPAAVGRRTWRGQLVAAVTFRTPNAFDLREVKWHLQFL
jgi:hypothetical protein